MLSEAEAMNFRISVESDDPQRNYFVGITTRADFDRLKTAQAVAETLVELEKGYGTIDWTTPDDQLIYRGNKTIDAGRIWSLKPKSDYAVVVFGVGAEGAITTDVFHDFISTTAVMPSQNRLSVSVAPESANVSVTTTNADPYFLDCIATSRIEGYPTDKLAEFLIGSYGSAISECIETGDVTRDFTRLLEEDTDYCASATWAVTPRPILSSSPSILRAANSNRRTAPSRQRSPTSRCKGPPSPSNPRIPLPPISGRSTTRRLSKATAREPASHN